MFCRWAFVYPQFSDIQITPKKNHFFSFLANFGRRMSFAVQFSRFGSPPPRLALSKSVKAQDKPTGAVPQITHSCGTPRSAPRQRNGGPAPPAAASTVPGLADLASCSDLETAGNGGPLVEYRTSGEANLWISEKRKRG
jgi:hypothetical protein